MFEDGIYVSYFSDDDKKKRLPQSVIIIRNQRVSVGINRNADVGIKAYLTKIAKLAQNQSSQEYDDEIEQMLGGYFQWNGYTPKPSDFFELNDAKGSKFTKIPLEWTMVEG